MTKSEFYFPSEDGKTQIHAVEWAPDGKPAAVLQIAHGVTEHILRYEAFAEYMTKKGFIVVGNDHLGHGTSIAEGGRPMYFGPAGSWDWVAQDFYTCKLLTEKKYPDIPYTVLGFSLGSFLVRTYLIQHPGEADAAILVGTGQISSVEISVAKLLTNREAQKTGEENPNPVIKKLAFENYNKFFSPNRTEFDWLCSDDESLDEYIADPLRGDIMSAGLFREMLNGMTFTAKLKNMKKMDKNMPVLLVSGDRDPVGAYGKGVLAVCRKFKKAGINDISMKLYPGLRHNVLGENCREEVYRDLYHWLKKKIPD